MSRLAVVACLIAASVTAQAGDAKKDAEIKWAKGVLFDFLQSTKSQEFEQAELLMTKDLKEAMDKKVREFVPGLRGWAAQLGIEAVAWSVSSEDISPDKDEAVFIGSFKKPKEETKEEATFKFRLIKDKDNGKWRVSYVHCDGWIGPKVEPKK